MALGIPKFSDEKENKIEACTTELKKKVFSVELTLNKGYVT
jgi:hypothetical protein